MWCYSNCDAFDKDADPTSSTYEHKVEHTQLHNKYCEEFEGLLKDYVAEVEGTMEQLFMEVKV